MTYFRNHDELLSHGNATLRADALDILDAGLAAADPGRKTRELVSLEGDVLRIAGREFDLRKAGGIYVLGAGKATFPIADALDGILGDRITDGLVICKEGQEGELKHCRMFLASHPIPGEAGLAAARRVLDLARGTAPGDIVLACITGGSSALMPLPVPEISLEDKKIASELLLTCGANIVEINAVRKHLSRIKGGLLALALHPGTVLVNLTVSDVIGDPYDYITDPTVPDTSSFADARRTLDKYSLWDKMPPPVAAYLKTAPAGRETPKALSGRTVINHMLVKGDDACGGAAAKARELGYAPMILSSMLEGESRETGRTFVCIGAEIVRSSRPLARPCAVIGGGETTVRLPDGKAGRGGPNQEFVLGAALAMDAMTGMVVAGLDTDGTDGPTHYAGGIADESTLRRANALGINIFSSLESHDASPVLVALGDALNTGNTGTNVNDLKLMLVGG
ncbi:MAG: DUF4147 domain-containing protein [Desulfovibrio sp.]|jgi:glycerate-2-kinase|nr:DUF4147 domain-containing protein [Desulfovibrio sp.]